jgi:hypothetical protein
MTGDARAIIETGSNTAMAMPARCSHKQEPRREFPRHAHVGSAVGTQIFTTSVYNIVSG